MLGILELFIRSDKLKSHLMPSGDMKNKSQFMNQGYPDEFPFIYVLDQLSGACALI